MAAPDVLIVGAGPSGLVLALWLTRQGVAVKIIDRLPGPGTTSRALAVQARTLELYDQAGLAQTVVANGQKVAALNLWVGGRRRARAPLDQLGAGRSAFPYPLIFPQDEHERFLIHELGKLGVAVDRSVELTGFEEREGWIEARLRRAGGAEESVRVAYLTGCDGAGSLVRHVIGAEFPGGTYAQRFYVADVQAHGPPVDGELHIDLDTADFVAVFPLKGRGRARLIGTVRGERAEAEDLSFADVSQTAIGSMRVVVDQVNWFSTYRVHHRVTSTFRRGRAFLVGDAAHIHSPAGGQGMNTGIGDAINLAWKLAAVIQGRARPGLLRSYETERIGFARALVATTDRAFTAATSASRAARFLRTRIAPLLAPAALRVAAVRRFMFRTVSQTAIKYRGSSLSEGQAGRVCGGDRPPWLQGVSNYADMDQVNWRVQVFGDPEPELSVWCDRAGLALEVFAWSDEALAAGYAENAAYLIRPDGYVALADPKASPRVLAAYFESRGLRVR